ncbi:DUF4349 domain-containing protein [Agromyces sp. LHK192]|uniref:DUF4349 domain-containing protein n=1 Tax=Agromyces sp. LHK192 TaxID=2498704 RepID=UPI000FD992D3|nr:DUF4349 domain-containing protein [Agromyces sp. LHK192]
MTRRLASAAAAAALLALLLAGCSAGAGSDSSAPMSGTAEHAPAEPGDGGGSAEGFVATGEAAADEAAGASDADRSVIRTGSISITVDDPIASADDVADLATGAGGRIDQRTEQPGTDGMTASADLVLRIPVDGLDAVVDDLRELGEVNRIALEASDVTQQREDLDARIEALGASVDRLTALLGQATTTADLIEIESELTTRQAELDSLTQQRDLLVDQVEFSTLSVSLVTEEQAPDARPDTFLDGLAAGWESLMAFGAGLLVVLGVLLPWIGLLALVAAIVVGVVLLVARGRRRPPQA